MPLDSFERRGFGREKGSDGRISGGMARLTVLITFLLEGVLGMSKSDIYKDYELTNFSYFNTPCSKGQFDEMFTMIEALEGETLEQKFRTYLTTEFAISEEDIEAFRTKMLGEDDGTSIDLPTTDNGLQTTEVYDLSGKLVSDNWLNAKSKGVYIFNGKKIRK